ncbi:MAG: phenylalanine--tRNA ligase subunit beta [Erysipelotrichaceae bacterium]|nr:phenylalanine--tRNA ligase subunit beta [Erysipelotrichaceae bacterium]
MKLSYNWLKEYVDLSDIAPEDLAERMTTAGLEVEGIEAMAQASGLAVGEVMSCEDIEGTHLHLTQTNVGNAVYQIVCGAPNCRKGLKVIAALPGAVLPGGTIEAKPLHGIASNGMLCSLLELGVDRKSLREDQVNGIEELPADAPVGERNVLKYLGLDDTILDVSLTPNRADCSAMWNMAKEVGAIVHREVKWPAFEGQSDIGEKGDFKVETKTEKCSCYLGKAVNHVKIGPSPKWMQQYLNAAGINAINNVVDISNFVMLETGQPLHYYDLKKLKGHDITVVDDQQLTMKALDGNEFAIQKGDILITENGEATGIAGIMGGEESMIDEDTDAIFIEAAHFDHASIRHTSIRLNLVTEAAQRFTKGIEEGAMAKAMDRSVQLLRKYADASGFEATVKAGTEKDQPLTVKETLTHCNGLLGTAFTMEQVADTLKWLDFKPEINGDEIISHIPSYRIDIEGKADIDEEVIRLIGFDSLNSTLPQIAATVGQLTPVQALRRTSRDAMMAMGLNEIMTYTLVGQDYIDSALEPIGKAVALAMPMSEARKYLRTSMINSVLECVQYNEAHDNQDLAFYEISKLYAQDDKEEERLAVVLDGQLTNDPLHKFAQPGDFYAMKGILLAWLKQCGYTGTRIRIKENQKDLIHFHPYRSAEIYLGKEFLGIFGEVHPEYAKKFDLGRIAYAELNIDPVLHGTGARIKFEELNKFQSVARDISLVVKRDVPAQSILEAIRRSGAKIVSDVQIFDVYEGEHVAADQKSVALHITYQADHTLKDDEINEAHKKILNSLKEKVKAELRA